MAVLYYNENENEILLGEQNVKLLYVSKADNNQAMIPTAFHSHANILELQYVSNGNANIYINNKIHKVKKGDVVVYNAGMTHDESAENEHGFEFYNFGIKDFKTLDLPMNHLLNFNTSPILHTGEMSESVQSIFKEVYEQISRKKISKRSVCHHLLNALFIILLKQIPHEPTKKITEFDQSFQKSLMYIDENFQNEYITIEKLSEIAHMSVSGFAHLFKKIMGLAPMQYVIRRRIGLAQNLLIRTDKSITEISLETGYDNVSHFNNQFKKIVGTSPQNYRKFWVGNEQFRKLNHIYNTLMS